MNIFSQVVLVLAMVCLASVGAQPQARQRSNSPGSRQKSKDMCHGKEMEKCYEQLRAISKADHSAEIIKTKDGLDRLCRSSDTASKCQDAYIKKCASPLQKEMFDLLLESFTKTIEEFCTNPQSKANLLVHSPCLVDKVFETEAYKNDCVERLLASIEYLNSTSRLTQDDRYDTICCGVTKWQQCTKGKVSTACDKNAYNAFERYILNTFGGFAGQICPEGVFVVDSQTCIKAFPPATFKSKGKLSDNPISQYISIYAGFLFGSAAN